jgi:hypothetical protein
VTAAGLLLCALANTGCRRDEIRAYSVPKEPKEKVRLLAAIIPQKDQTWFVKLMGPADNVEAQRESFLKFVRSIRFPMESG